MPFSLPLQKYYDVDGLNDPIGYPNQPNAPPIPSPFIVSRDLIRDEIASSNSAARNLTPAVMQFGQFLDHDLDLSAGGEGSMACRSIRYFLDGLFYIFIG
jgi:hypothetical protein